MAGTEGSTVTVAENLQANRDSGGGVFAKWVVESPGDTCDSVANLMATAGLPLDWEPSSVRRARDGEADAVESQARLARQEHEGSSDSAERKRENSP